MLALNGVEAHDWQVFDPTDIPRLFAQDEAIEREWTTGFNVPAHRRTDAELAVEVVALRNALLLPFCDLFRDFIDVEHLLAIEEVSRRMSDSPRIWRAL